jgi:predicted deacylase
VLADLLMREVVLRSDYGIDIHTAALHRSNLPQIRISPEDDELMTLAETFGAPVILVSKLRDGSLRQSALDRGVKVLVYEGGEALRFEERAIEAAVTGILRVLPSRHCASPPCPWRAIGCVHPKAAFSAPHFPLVIGSSAMMCWV